MVNHKAQYKDITGQRFGRWTVIEPAGKTSDNHKLWHCRCDCGIERNVVGKELRNGKSKSCGCLSTDTFRETITKHGLRYHPLYVTWCNIHARCENSNNPEYKHYGGRGIRVCDEWKDVTSFIGWAEANGYRSGLQIDRIDNNGNYEPDNCRFVTHTGNQNNKRTNRLLTYEGRTQTISQWAKELNVPSDRIRSRLNMGWNVEDVLFKPKQRVRA